MRSENIWQPHTITEKNNNSGFSRGGDVQFLTNQKTTISEKIIQSEHILCFYAFWSFSSILYDRATFLPFG